jgi:hypothetical protein
MQPESLTVGSKDLSVHLKEGKLSVEASHSEKNWGAEVKAWYDAKELLNKAIDAIEEKIPGDQKIVAATFKGVLAGIEF